MSDLEKVVEGIKANELALTKIPNGWKVSTRKAGSEFLLDSSGLLNSICYVEEAFNLEMFTP